MNRRLAISGALLGALAVAGLPAAAGDPSFDTEAVLAFGYEGSRIEEPLVVIAGTPSNAFGYDGDTRGASASAAATRFFGGGVTDDGVTPLGLLPFVSRRSRAGASLRLTGGSRDSQGTSRGETITVTSVLSGDRTVRDGALSGEWYVTDAVAILPTLGGGVLRATDVTTVIERPSFRGNVSTFGSRSRSVSGGLGVRAWLGSETAIRTDVTLSGEEFSRTSATTLGDLEVRSNELTRAGTSWSAGLEVRRLFARRRADVSVSGRYAGTRATVDEVAPSPRRFDEPRAIARSLTGRAAWYPLRTLGVAAAIRYATADATSGVGFRRPSQADKSVELSLSADWFLSPRAAASLVLEREETTTLLPPDSATFQKLVETAWRVTLAARLRL